jgi:putative membrane protein
VTFVGYCYGWTGAGLLGGFGWIIPLLFWGLLIITVIFLFKSFRKDGNQEALDILNEEYALGRISREDFLERKKDLEE